MSDDLFGDVQDDSILEHMDDSDLENVKFPVLIAELNDLLRYEFQRIGIAPLTLLKSFPRSAAS